MIEVQAQTTTIQIPDINIIDDSINEDEEVFVVVARILGTAADVACFQLDRNSQCKRDGSVGGTLFRIYDNDGKEYLQFYN